MDSVLGLLYQFRLILAKVSGTISITAQCIEPQLMPNESLGRDLHIRHRSLYVRSVLHGVIYVTKCQCLSNCISFLPSFFFFFLLATFYLLATRLVLHITWFVMLLGLVISPEVLVLLVLCPLAVWPVCHPFIHTFRIKWH